MAEHCKISAAIVAESEERSYDFKIVDGYWRTKRLVKKYGNVNSPRFSVGGHDWILRYYPNNGDLVSVYLILDSDDAKDVKACFQFLASPSNLEAMIASDGYEHLKRSCPFVLKELVARLLPVELKAAKVIVMAI